jgi:hypothetical protein
MSESANTAVELTESSVNPSLVEVKIAEKQALTEFEKDLVQRLYDNGKDLTQSILTDSTSDNSMKITQLIAQLMILMDKLPGEKISGPVKKAVALELGKALIKDLVQENTTRVKILLLYDVLAEPTLETMIDVSRVVNKQMKEAAQGCWDCIIAMCGTKKPLTEEEQMRRCA